MKVRTGSHEVVIGDACESIISATILVKENRQYLPMMEVDYAQFKQFSEGNRFTRGLPQYFHYQRDIKTLQIWPCAECDMILHVVGQLIKEY